MKGRESETGTTRDLSRRRGGRRSSFTSSDWMEPFRFGTPLARFPFGMPEFGGWRQPAVDIRDAGDTYEVTVELPGISKDNVEVNVNRDRLEIRAEETTKEEDQDEGYFQREIGQRSFYRSLTLPPDSDTEKVEAELEDGCLCVTVEKKEGGEESQRRIRVK